MGLANNGPHMELWDLGILGKLDIGSRRYIRVALTSLYRRRIDQPLRKQQRYQHYQQHLDDESEIRWY